MNMIDLRNPQEAKRFADEQGIPVKALYEMDIQNINMALGKTPDNPRLYLNRAFDNYIIQNFEAAISDYSKVIELSPSNAEAYHYLGNCYAHLKQDEKAIGYFNKAIELKDYKYIDSVYNDLAISYIMLGDFNHALDSITKAIENMNGVVGSYYKIRSGIYHELKDYDNSEKDWNIYRAKTITSYLEELKMMSYREKKDFLSDMFDNLNADQQNMLLAGVIFDYNSMTDNL